MGSSENASNGHVVGGSTRLVVEDEDRLRVMELATMCTVPMALKAAVQLDVPEIISRAGPDALLSASEIVSQIPASKTPLGGVYLDRILRVLASRGIFKEEVAVDAKKPEQKERKYGLTRMCKFLIKDDKNMSLAPMVLMNQDEIFMKSWQFLHGAVLDGDEPFTKAHGKTEFELATQDPRLDSLFNVAMSNHSKLYMQAILEAYDGFKDVGTLVDVGGGIGTSLSVIVAAHPHLKGINFDQPHVVAEAPDYPGVEHVGGDMFQSVPKGDAIFMKWILHDWGDEACIKLLKNCYQSIPSNGKIIVVDSVLPSSVDHGPGSRVSISIDLLMLAYNSGGKERTEEEFRKLAEAAGFAEVKVAVTVDFISVVELYKHTE